MGIKVKSSGSWTDVAVASYDYASLTEETAPADADKLPIDDGAEKYVTVGTLRAPEWHRISDPSTGYFAEKTTGWSSDSWDFEVDFSSVVPAGTLAVEVVVHFYSGSAGTFLFSRPSGDTNISSTPNASEEWSQIVRRTITKSYHTREPEVIWLSSDLKAQFAASSASQAACKIAYPRAYYK